MIKWICQNCGDTVKESEDLDPWDCSYCGGRMLPEDKSDVTPNAELRELIEDWRQNHLPRNGSFRQAANELEELIEDED